MLATFSIAFMSCSEFLRGRKLLLSRSVQSRDDVDFNILEANTSFKRQELIKYLQEFKNVCPEGALSPNVFERVYKKFYPRGNIRTFCKKAFRSFDRNEDGQMDFVEFILALDIIGSKSRKKKFDWFFRLSDTDKNGVIDKDEFVDVYESVNSLMSSSSKSGIVLDVHERMVLYDRQRKGFLTKDEFLVACDSEKVFKRLIFGSCSLD